MIQLYNTPERQKVGFKPQLDNRVSLYTCGPTVYGDLTIGNWTTYIRWDLLVRLLIAHGFNVERVMNITDVGHLTSDADTGEDKMEKGARRDNISAWEVSKRYTNSFVKGMDQLNMIQPTHMVKATQYIDKQIELIKTLEAKGHTYQTSDGIYFDTSTFPSYAEFANLHLDELKAGARVEQNNEKRSATDFALWKFSPHDRQRDMEWDSPWGVGFPGWHIECSAIAMDLLGQTIDIHTGGIDHIPVHHTNEIAQSQSATGKTFVNYWLHANFLLVNGTKISKSLGNGYTLEDLWEKGYSANDFRMFVLQSHYRSQSNFTWANLDGARNRLNTWMEVAELRWQLHDTTTDDEDKSISDISLRVRHAKADILAALDNDLGSPEALRIIESVFDDIVAQRNNLQQDVLIDLLDFIESITGFDILSTTPDIDEDAKLLLVERVRARDNKDYQLSDQLRQQLGQKGIDLRDDVHGQVWSRRSRSTQ